MEALTHWTQNSTADFIHSISSNFIAQIETKIEEQGISQSAIANKMKKTDGRVSQVLNAPGNLSIRVMVELARALGMKVSIVAYDDHDPDNNRGPIDPDVFRKCWEYSERPQNLFDVDRAFPYASGYYSDVYGSQALSGANNIVGTAVVDFHAYTKRSGICQNRASAA